MKIFLILVTSVIAFVTSSLWAQQVIDARATGMAFSNGADTRGLEYVGLNPATLALPNPFNFEFNLISANASVSNNSFNKDEYDRYFTTGDLLTSQDVQDILNLIPGKGLRATAAAKVNTLAFYTRNLSISFTGLGGATVNIPKDLIELPLTGNRDPGRIYRLDDAEGSGWAGLGINLSGAYPFHTEQWHDIDLLSAGVTLRYIVGFGGFEVQSAQGEFRDFDTSQNLNYAHLNGEVDILTSEGGNGFAADLGGLVTYKKKWTIGITAVNLFGNINWNKNVERNVFSMHADSLSLPDDIPDTVFTDTTFSAGDFSTRLPAALDMAVAYQWQPNVLIAAEFEKGFSDNLGGSKKARLAMGLEYTALKVLPLRTGLSLGGRTGSVFGLGIGLNLKYWILDLAYLNHGGIFPGNSKGLTLSVTTRFRF